MKIKKTIQKEEVIEIEIETPVWYKKTFYSRTQYYQVLSENDVIEVEIETLLKDVGISRGPLKFVYQGEKIFESEKITEDEFKQVLAEAITIITNTVPEPLAV